MDREILKNEFSEQYSEEKFWGKVKRFAGAAGKGVIVQALTLFFTLKDKDTPMWAKGVIVGALGYFISPLDAIPDAIPAAGYTDDLGVLTAAMGMVALHIKPEHREKAEQTWKGWFGGSDEGPETPDPQMVGE